MMTMTIIRAGSRQLIQAASLLVVALLLAAQFPAHVDCQEQLSIESRQQKDNDDLTDTIKYLEKLDKYFSQIARPRFGRSEYKQARQLQPSWSRFSRPTAFGPDIAQAADQKGALEYGAGAELLDLARSRLY